MPSVLVRSRCTMGHPWDVEHAFSKQRRHRRNPYHGRDSPPTHSDLGTTLAPWLYQMSAGDRASPRTGHRSRPWRSHTANRLRQRTHARRETLELDRDRRAEHCDLAILAAFGLPHDHGELTGLIKNRQAGVPYILADADGILRACDEAKAPPRSGEPSAAVEATTTSQRPDRMGTNLWLECGCRSIVAMETGTATGCGQRIVKAWAPGTSPVACTSGKAFALPSASRETYCARASASRGRAVKVIGMGMGMGMGMGPSSVA